MEDHSQQHGEASQGAQRPAAGQRPGEPTLNAQPSAPKPPEPDPTMRASVPEPPGAPEPNGNGSLRSIQTLITISIIAGPVSMIIGGVILSLVALACAIVALVKARRLRLPEGTDGALLQTIQRQAMVGIGIGVVAFGFNAVSLAMIMPTVIDAVQSGDLSSLTGGAGSAGNLADGSSAADSADGGSKSSVWG